MPKYKKAALKAAYETLYVSIFLIISPYRPWIRLNFLPAKAGGQLPVYFICPLAILKRKGGVYAIHRAKIPKLMCW